MQQQYGETTCARHSKQVTNLRCGRCNDPICVRCMVHSPVGARCPKCAQSGKSAALAVTYFDLLKGAGAAVVLGVVAGVAIQFIANLIFRIVPLQISVILPITIAVLFVVLGSVSAGVVRRAGGYKPDPKFGYIAAFAVLIAFIAGIISAWLFGLPNFFNGLLPIVGMGLGALTALRRT